MYIYVRMYNMCKSEDYYFKADLRLKSHEKSVYEDTQTSNSASIKKSKVFPL